MNTQEVEEAGEAPAQAAATKPWPPMVSKKHRTLAGVGLTLAAVGIGGWLALRSHPAPHRTPKGMTYTASGYGGFVFTPQRNAPHPARTLPNHGANALQSVDPVHSLDPIQPLRDAYNAGQYQVVEAAALRLVATARTSRIVAVHERAVEARSLLAYSAARRHDLTLARARFAMAWQEAALLPDKGKQAAVAGQPEPTLEEDAAFQHAVCTGALNDLKAAEAEYLAFMKHYPESPLVQASIKRIARMHGGDVPPAAEAVWRQAGLVAQAQQRARNREASLCGPACLAELLRRRGGTVNSSASVHALADEMHTGDRGTALADLAVAANRRGFAARGLALTPKGLAAQTLPVIALVTPGHYVLVDAVSAQSVTVWDPDARGPGRGGRLTIPLAQWGREWRGVTLALSPPDSVRTDRR